MGDGHALVRRSELPDDLKATALSLQGLLKSRRRSRQIYVRSEMDRCREHLHPENIQVVPSPELSDQRSKTAQTYETDIFGELEERTRGPFTMI